MTDRYKLIDRDRLIELFSPFADGTYIGSGTIIDGTKVYDVVDYLLANDIIVPPGNVGDKVYCIVFLPIGCYWCVQKGFVREIRITEENVSVNIVDCENTKYANLNIIVPITDFGKTVFLTKEKAEQKLKELGK